MKRFKIFVINLDESTARLERLKSEFERIGLNFERLPAVDGRKLNESQILKHYSLEQNRKKYFKPLSKPEIGLYMSHLKACEKIISENLDFGIILEDDIVLKEGFQIVPQVLSAINIEWKYISLIEPKNMCEIRDKIPIKMELSLSVHIEKYSANVNAGACERSNEIRNVKVPITFELVTCNKPSRRTHAFAISRGGAKELMSGLSMQLNSIASDQQCERKAPPNIYGLRPSFLTSPTQ